MRRFTRDIIIDALGSPAAAGHEPGGDTQREAEDVRGGRRHGSAHSSGLDAVLEFGRMQGNDGPEEVIVFAIEAEGAETVGETRSPYVAGVAQSELAPVREKMAAA